MQGGGSSSTYRGVQLWHPTDEPIEPPEEAADYLRSEVVSDVCIGVLNVASFAKHIQMVAETDCDVVIIPESRLVDDEEADVRHKMEVLGYSMLTLNARKINGVVQAEGIVIIARRPLRLIELALPETLETWKNKRRFLAAQIVLPGGVGPIAAYYGHAGARWSHHDDSSVSGLMQAVADWKISKNIRSCILAGDFNAAPGEIGYEAALATGVWQDVQFLFAEQRLPTFVSHAGSSIIDHVLADDVALAHCVGAATEEDSYVQHRLTWAKFLFPSTTAVLQPSLPVFEISACKPRPEEKCINWSWHFHESELAAAYKDRDVERAWTAWCVRWEEASPMAFTTRWATSQKSTSGTGHFALSDYRKIPSCESTTWWC